MHSVQVPSGWYLVWYQESSQLRLDTLSLKQYLLNFVIIFSNSSDDSLQASLAISSRVRFNIPLAQYGKSAQKYTSSFSAHASFTRLKLETRKSHPKLLYLISYRSILVFFNKHLMKFVFDIFFQKMCHKCKTTKSSSFHVCRRNWQYWH